MYRIERSNILYRLNSGRNQYVKNGGQLSRKVGSYNTIEKKVKYNEVINLLKRGYSIRNTAKLTGFSVSTVQRDKKEFAV
ncbi:MAG: helix-turn-helix domain-containing protein [Fermentimonas sp.]